LRVIGWLLRVYSYVFHLILSLFLLAVALISATSHQPLNLGMLPFSTDNMRLGVFALGVIGLLATLLAITRLFKYLFPLWALVVVYLLIKGFLFSSYSFGNPAEFRTALWLIFAAIVAFCGALWTLRPRRGRLYY
jgi:hypothetical protein